MRHVLCGLAAAAVALHAAQALAQNGVVQVSGASQTVTGNPQRTSGEHLIDPDFGISWIQPGVRFGNFQIELRGARRADRLHMGRNYAALRDVKHGRFSWTFEAGDAYFTRTVGEYGFTNLTTPAVTFSGGVITARSRRGTLSIIGGRATAWRNIFGSDPDTMAQTMGLMRGSFKASDRLDLFGRISRVQTSGLREFSFNIADGKQAGGGALFRLTPGIQFIADGSAVQYRRLDSGTQVRDSSYLVGTNLLLPRGWVQINTSRFSPGEFPAMNDPLHDREGTFAAAEYDVWSRIRVFGGFEAIRTNIDPDPSLPASRDLPRNRANRGFGGVQVRLATGSTFTVRLEEGDRVARFEHLGRVTESDTGLRSAEWQGMFGRFTAYGRYARRLNVDIANRDASYTQDDVSAQLYVRLNPTVQLFTLTGVTRHHTGTPGGSSYFQIGGGGQMQLFGRNLWLRGEGNASRNVDLLTRDFVPRQSFNVGFNGQVARATALSFNIAIDRTPLLFGTGTPWTARSMVRVTQTFSTGAARVTPATPGFRTAAARARGTGTIIGRVYTDWNGNGTQDPDEEPLENIPIRIVGSSTVTTRRDGEFAFLDVPTGPQQVGVDTGAVPIDFDPPAVSAVDLDLDRGATRRVSFGLMPLGTVRGRVVRDANGNGKVDPGEEPIDGAVLVLDGGSRSEEVRRGAYRFDAIRSGDHVISLLRDSLPEGAVITGAPEVPLALKRNQLTVDVDFLVTIEKRPETRKVFPSRGGLQPPPSASREATSAPARTVAAAPAGAAASPANRTPAAAPPAAAARAATSDPSSRYAVQIAALNDPLRARLMVRDLSAAGFPAYLVAPAASDPDGPYRVRVGRYRTKQAASGAAATLQKLRGEKLWVINEPPTP